MRPGRGLDDKGEERRSAKEVFQASFLKTNA